MFSSIEQGSDWLVIRHQREILHDPGAQPPVVLVLQDLREIQVVQGHVYLDACSSQQIDSVQYISIQFSKSWGATLVPMSSVHLCGVVGYCQEFYHFSVNFFSMWNFCMRSKQSDSLTPFYQLVYQVVVILEPLWVDGSSSSCAHIEGEKTNYYGEREIPG